MANHIAIDIDTEQDQVAADTHFKTEGLTNGTTPATLEQILEIMDCGMSRMVQQLHTSAKKQDKRAKKPDWRSG